jgi:hypothetical protein
MSVGVNLHVDLLVISLATIRADERFVTSVRAHVCVEIGGAVEGLVARGTHVWFDCGVSETMSSQVPRLTESTSANFTFEWLITGVDSLKNINNDIIYV